MVVYTGIRAFEVKCTNCNWQETVTVKPSLLFPMPFPLRIGKRNSRGVSWAIKRKLRSHCPECNSDTTYHELLIMS